LVTNDSGLDFREKMMDTGNDMANSIALSAKQQWLTTLFCGHPDTSTQTPPVEQVCWTDAYDASASFGPETPWQ
jgi:hypothetical protein